MNELKLSDANQCRAEIARYLIRTPVFNLDRATALKRLGLDAETYFKLEHLQNSGSFKLRGALSFIHSMDKAKIQNGFTAVSAGNHAIATAYAAMTLGTSAKVVMLKTANPERVRKAIAYGAEVIIAENGETAFQKVAEIQNEERRTFIHPFDGPRTTLGTATLALEWMEQVGEPLDAVLVAVGGGGLASGIAYGIKQKWPQCKVFGVNPAGAEAMRLSFEKQARVPNAGVVKIADSLCPPFVGEFALEVCLKYLDGMVVVSEAEIRHSMRLLFDEFKLMIEGAGAAALAAALFPLKQQLVGKRIGILVSGSNIDPSTFLNDLSIQRDVP